MEYDQVILAAKIVVFAFIITSPFYNVGNVFSFANNVAMKVLLLFLIIGASFVDLQLAIIMAIAFFIIMINMNNVTISSASPSSQVLPYKPLPTTTVSPLRSPSSYATNDLVSPFERVYPALPNQTIDLPVFDAEYVPATAPLPPAHASHASHASQPIAQPPVHNSSDDHVMQNMYEFPNAECNTPRELNDHLVNESLIQYFIDDKIKPYEDFISQLTNEELLESVSNGAFIA